jgi:hypothetical protein
MFYASRCPAGGARAIWPLHRAIERIAIIRGVYGEGRPLWSIPIPLTNAPATRDRVYQAFAVEKWASQSERKGYSKLITSRCGMSKEEYDFARSSRLLSTKAGFWSPPVAASLVLSSILDHV